MKSILHLLLLLSVTLLQAQHTFSIVAVDPETGEIGSAGATCIAAEDGAQAISDIILGTGAIHTQSFYIPANQNNARARMEAGDSPQEIMDWLVANDVNNDPSQRQYIAVDRNGSEPRSAGYTGVDCFEEFTHLSGANYAIAGNILISEAVVLDMESAFLATEGSLADKLMAALQGAKRPGADIRCLDEGISSASAFIRVADPSDTDSGYGNLSLDLNVWITSELFEPIDELQLLFDEQLSLSNTAKPEYIRIYPNPTAGRFSIKTMQPTTEAILYNLTGKVVLRRKTTGNLTELNISQKPQGIYFLSITYRGKRLHNQKILLRK